MLGDIRITAVSGFGEQRLKVTAIIANDGTEDADVRLSGDLRCQLMVRLYDEQSANPVLDEAPEGKGCFDIGGEVTVGSGQEYHVVTVRTRAELEGKAVGRGTYHVVAVLGSINGEWFLPVSAGVVRIE